MRTFIIIFLLALTSTGKAATVLVFGDSLSTGYGLNGAPSWVELLNKDLGPRYSVFNASQDGRLLTNSSVDLQTALNEYQPDIVLFALGVNDGNQKVSLREVQSSLLELISKAQQNGAQVTVLNVRLPNSANQSYANDFEEAVMATAYGADALYLDWITHTFLADHSNLQSDGLHLGAKAQKPLQEAVSVLLDRHGL